MFLTHLGRMTQFVSVDLLPIASGNDSPSVQGKPIT